MNNKKKQLKRQTNRKFYGIGIFLMVAIIFAVFIGRFFYIGAFKTVDKVNLSKKVSQLYASKTQVKAQRGTIYDNDNQPIAEDSSTYSIYIVLSKKATAFGKREYLATKDKPKAARVLSKYLEISYQEVLKDLNPSDRDLYQVELGSAGRNLSLETKQEIEAAGITGINFTSTSARLYPNGIFASHIIGLAENQAGQLTGVSGIEKAFNKALSGHNGVRSFEKDTRGTPIPGSKVKSRAAKNGDNLYTTLDTRLQTYLETLMSQAQSTYHPQEMTAILMKASTGEILAATQRPTYNAQTKAGINQIWRNILAQDSYEPGSTMKVFTMAAAINSGVYNQNATFKSGSYEIDGKKVDDWDTNGWGYITYRDAFIRSSNVGMAHLEQQMGAKTWLKYIKKFGLLKKTGSKMPDETSGSIEFGYPIEQANTAFGQAIDVTALQMMQGFSAIANHGKMVKPYLVKRVVNPNNGKTVYQAGTKVVGKPIRSQTASQVLSMMQDVVYNENGTGSAFKINGYRIGVKTGTAQISNSKGTGYLTGETNYLFSVVGMAPASNPKYILYITMKQPTTFAGQTSGQMLASVFNPMMKRVLDEDQETTNQKQTQVTLPDVTGQSVTKAKTALNNAGLLVTVIGNGKKITAQSIAGGQTSLTGERIILLANGERLMPDLTGWSRSNVAALANLLNIKVSFQGSGYVKSQSLAANKSLTNQKNIVVQLK